MAKEGCRKPVLGVWGGCCFNRAASSLGCRLRDGFYCTTHSPSDDLGLEPHTANRVIPSSDQWRCGINITDDRMGLTVSGPTLEWPIDSESWERKGGGGRGVFVCSGRGGGVAGRGGVGVEVRPSAWCRNAWHRAKYKGRCRPAELSKIELHRWCGSLLQCGHSSEGGLKTQRLCWQNGQHSQSRLDRGMDTDPAHVTTQFCGSPFWVRLLLYETYQVPPPPPPPNPL